LSIEERLSVEVVQKISNQLNRLGLGLVSTFMDCKFDTNMKQQIRVRCHSLNFEPSKIMAAYKTIHKFNSQ